MDVQISCVCPPTDAGPRHPDGDTISFRERLDFRSALAIRNQVALEAQDDPDLWAGETLAILTEAYLIFGIESWTLRDGKGKPLPVTRANIRVFMDEYPDEAMTAGNVGDRAYQAQVLLPLLKRASMSSPSLSTPEQTSATPESSGPQSPTKRRRPSSRSSTITTPMVATEPTTLRPDGGSKSSRNSASAV